MKNDHIRMTIEFDVNLEALKEKGLSVNDILNNLTFSNHDVIDGFEISTNVPGFDNTSDFFLANGKIVSKEIVEDYITEEKLQAVMKDALEARGYEVTDEKLEELWGIYEDCQEWNVIGEMTTGFSYDEVVDFVKHSSSVDEVFNENYNETEMTKEQKIKLCELYNGSDIQALMYMKDFATKEQKEFLDRLIYLNQETKLGDGDKDYSSDEDFEYSCGKWLMLSFFGLENRQGDAYFEGVAYGTGFEYPELEKAVDHYNLITGKKADRKFAEENADKIMLCYEKAIDYINIDFWKTYETLLNDSLTYREYVYIDAHYEGDPFEIASTIINHKIIEGLKKDLEVFRGKYKDAIDSLCENLNMSEDSEFEREVEAFIPVFETDKHICIYYYMDGNEWYAVDKESGKHTLILDDSYVWINNPSLNIFGEDTVLHIAEPDLMFNLADSSEYLLSSVKDKPLSDENMKGINVLKKAFEEQSNKPSLENMIHTASEKVSVTVPKNNRTVSEKGF